MAPPLNDWETFYVIVGSSAAALTGLMFVVIALIKDSGLKVQVAIMDDIVRISGKKIDDLQAIIQASKGWDLGLALQYVNMKN